MRFADLFSGCGGLSLGLEAAGFERVFAAEKDPAAAATYWSNMCGNKAVGTNSQSVQSWAEWYRQHGLDRQITQGLVLADVEDLVNWIEANPDRVSRIDMLAGGPPCQGFSTVGLRNPFDPRNSLPGLFVRAVDVIRPKSVVMENVDGLRHRSVAHNGSSPFYALADKIEKLGYIVQRMVLNARHYGVPQHRRRAIIIAVREDIARRRNIEVTTCTWDTDRNGTSIERSWPTLVPKLSNHNKQTSTSEAIADLYSSQRKSGYVARLHQIFRQSTYCSRHESRNNWPMNHEVRRHSERVARRFEIAISLAEAGIWENLFYLAYRDEWDRIELSLRGRARNILRRLGHRSIESLCDELFDLATKKHSQRVLGPDEPAPTILSLPDDLIHYAEPRTLTVREEARLQSFPDWFIFSGKATTGGVRRATEVPQYTQVANAVPPLLARAIGRHVMNVLSQNAVQSKKIYRCEVERVNGDVKSYP